MFLYPALHSTVHTSMNATAYVNHFSHILQSTGFFNRENNTLLIMHCVQIGSMDQKRQAV